MSPQPSIVDQAKSPTVAAEVVEKETRPVNWDKLQAEHSPSSDVADAVKQVFKEDAEILRQLA
jgi:hypothetical protein